MNLRPPRKSFGARARRFLQRRAFSLIFVSLLAAAIIARFGVAARSQEQPATILGRLPPVAAKPVRMDVKDAKISVILAELSRQVGVPFLIEWQSLASNEGVDRDSPLTLETRGQCIPLAEALRRLCPDGHLAADYTVNPIVITTLDELERTARLITVAYPIRDLLQTPDPWKSRGDDQIHVLRNTIESVCGHDTWDESGGNSSIREEHGQLLIRTSPNTHYMVKQLLEQLRRQ